MKRSRRGQIVQLPKYSEIKAEVKTEAESDISDLDDEIPVDSIFFSGTDSEDGYCPSEHDPLQPGPSSIFPGVSTRANTRRASGIGRDQGLKKAGFKNKNKPSKCKIPSSKDKVDLKKTLKGSKSLQKKEKAARDGKESTKKKKLAGMREAPTLPDGPRRLVSLCESQETPEAREKRLKRKSEARRNRINRESEEQKMERRAKAAQATKLARAQLLAKMTPEDRQALKDKDAEQARKRRGKTQMSEEERRQMLDKKAAQTRLWREKRLEKMTQEEKQALKDKHAEAVRLKRAKLYKNLTLDEHQALKDKGAEDARRRREMKLMTEQERQQVLEKRAAQTRQWREKKMENMTEEEKQAWKDKHAENVRLKRSAKLEEMTPEEVQSWKDKRNEEMKLWRSKNFGNMTQEEQQAIRAKKALEKAKNRDKHRLQYATDEGNILETEEEKEKLRQVQELQKRLKMEGLSVEEKLDIRLKVRELRKVRLAKIKELRKRYLESLSEDDRWRLKMDRYLKDQAYRSGKEKIAHSAMPQDWLLYQRHVNQKYRESLTPDGLQRLEESTKRSAKKRQEKLKWEELQGIKSETPEQIQKRREYQKRRLAHETEEQRQKRLTLYKLSHAKKKLQREMEQEGTFTQEEFEKRAEKIVEKIRIQPGTSVSAYKSRPGRPRKISNEKTLHQEVKEYMVLNPHAATAPTYDFTIEYAPKADEDEQSNGPCSPVGSFMDSLLESETDDTNDFQGFQQLPVVIESVTLKPGGVAKPKDELSLVVPQETKLVEACAEVKEESFNDKGSLGCKHCVEKFCLEDDLRAHTRSKHPGRCWTCPMCKKVILSPTELVEHFKTEHSEKDKGQQGNEDSRKTTEEKEKTNPAPSTSKGKAPGRRKSKRCKE